MTLDEIDAAISAARQEAFNTIDSDDDGLLIETEVSGRLWSKISEADADASGGVSLEELDTYLAEQTTESTVFSSRLHRHHHGNVDKAFAQLGRSGIRGQFAMARRR